MEATDNMLLLCQVTELQGGYDWLCGLAVRHSLRDREVLVVVVVVVVVIVVIVIVVTIVEVVVVVVAIVVVVIIIITERLFGSKGRLKEPDKVASRASFDSRLRQLQKCVGSGDDIVPNTQN
ncbi:hypothetical protein ElyMa_002602000 [Elysia marginata]|uniref:Uncharacterized protein n=1 Tax=Elysia marginata TaxID=1093978 RepID=A0AAV4H5C4_9GAST|nr:hypothetical protein ElyMa_002602000 [Elysia marginata]